ncbi:flippase [Pontibacter sp. CAU 1760]
MMLGYVVRIISKFLVGIYIARYLGAEDFGLYNYAMSFALMFQVLSHLGLKDLIVRSVAGKEHDEKRLLGVSLILKVGGAVLALFVTFISSFFINNFDETVLIMVASFYVLFESFDLFEYYFQAKVASKFSVYSNMITTVAVSGLKFLFIFLKLPLIYFVGTFAIEGLIYSVSLFYFFRTNYSLSLQLFPLDRELAVKLLKNSWPLAIAMGVSLMNGNMDKIIVKNMLNDASLGYYVVGMRIFTSFNYIPFTICASLFPAIINAKKKSAQQYEKRMKDLYTLMLWMSVAFAGVLVVFAEELIILLFTEKFAPSISVLRISAFCLISLFLNAAFSKYIIAENLVKINLIRTVCSVAANLLLDLLLIPYYGVVGAAYASLGSSLVSIIVVPIMLKDTRLQVKWMFGALVFSHWWGKKSIA